ncbi:MAG: hypothetical protein ACRD4U_03945 [Candidatus Acidiferrales bacterium]
MNWKLIVSLSGFGVVMGVLSVLGLSQGIEGWLWLALCIFCAGWMGTQLAERRFLHGFLTGLIGGAVAPVIQALFFSTYVANNPEFMQAAGQLPPGISPRIITVVAIPLGGLLSGVVLGLLTMLAGKVLYRSS